MNYEEIIKNLENALADKTRECEVAQRERDEAWRSRERIDCRFAGRFVEMSGSHCPIENPCIRCQAELAEAALASLRVQVPKLPEK